MRNPSLGYRLCGRHGVFGLWKVGDAATFDQFQFASRPLDYLGVRGSEAGGPHEGSVGYPDAGNLLRGCPAFSYIPMDQKRALNQVP